jgi:hypothetical protein
LDQVEGRTLLLILLISLTKLIAQATDPKPDSLDKPELAQRFGFIDHLQTLLPS